MKRDTGCINIIHLVSHWYFIKSEWHSNLHLKFWSETNAVKSVFVEKFTKAIFKFLTKSPLRTVCLFVFLIWLNISFIILIPLPHIWVHLIWQLNLQVFVTPIWKHSKESVNLKITFWTGHAHLLNAIFKVGG